MNNQYKTKKELIKELEELKQAHDALKVSYKEHINKRKIMEDVLNLSERNYHLLAQNSSDVTWTLDNEFRFTYISPSIYQLRGLTSEEAMCESIQDTMTPHSLELVHKAILKDEENKRVKNYLPARLVVEQYHKNGYLIWVEISIQPMINDLGEKIGYIGNSRKITHQKVIEKESKEAVDRLDALLTNVPIGLYVFWIRANGHMEFEYVSDRWCDILQISREEALADISLVNKHIHEDEIENFLLLNEEAARERKKFVWEGRFTNTGENRWLRIESIPIAFNNGDTQWYGIHQEITERKQAEKALRQSEEKFRSLTNTAKVVISITTEASGTKYLYVNDEWHRVFGYSKEEVQNLKPIDLVAPECRQLVMDNAAKRIEGKQVKANYELKVITKSGAFKYLDFSSTIINFDNKTAFLTTAVDISKRKQAEEALRESETKLSELNAQKDKFFSIIAHDLKSPFNSIMGFSELLIEHINRKDYHGIDKYAKIISQSSQLAMDLLINLLDWSRVKTDKMKSNPENLDLADLIEENKILYDTIACQKAITLKKVLPHELSVFADRPMINTVIRNLISNAIKFTKESGVVKISAEKRTNEIFISVSDNGIGIAPERLKKLFRIDEYDSTLGTKNEKGTGLGLILCKEFVENHGGKIWAESEVEKGSTFYFTLSCNSN